MRNENTAVPGILPLPVEYRESEGSLSLAGGLRIEADKGFEKICGFFDRQLKTVGGFPPPKDDAAVTSVKLDSSLGDDHYRLSVSCGGIELEGGSERAVLYGMQSLFQMISTGLLEGGEPEIGCCVVNDYPRFEWRGLMFDESRHFFGPEVVRELLDIMALMKMNRFHWHLTDDQGWRIEIKSFPGLAEKASYRKDTSCGGGLSRRTEGRPHSGYYTQKQIREIVSYAGDLGIEVIPEIEFPGHCTAVLSVYPELSCRGEKLDIPVCAGGVYKDVYCPGREEVFSFLHTVLDEVVELFPSQWIHIGGDEAPTGRWKRCPDCRRRMKTEGLSSERELQHYMTKRLTGYLKNKGKSVIGWNEILNDELDSSVIGQFWTGDRKKMERHIEKGGRIIRTDYWFLYLDLSYFMIPLRKTASFDPAWKGSERGILGLEAPIWTEWIPDRARLHWQIFPRLAAAAEAGWSRADRTRDDYRKRFRRFERLLSALGVRGASRRCHSPFRLGGIFKHFFFLWDSGEKLHKKDLKRQNY